MKFELEMVQGIRLKYMNCKGFKRYLLSSLGSFVANQLIAQSFCLLDLFPSQNHLFERFMKFGTFFYVCVLKKT